VEGCDPQKGQQRKALASLALLVVWELWKERDARVFHRQHDHHEDQGEANIWSIAGAKALRASPAVPPPIWAPVDAVFSRMGGRRFRMGGR
jgi:hypothetical protein